MSRERSLLRTQLLKWLRVPLCALLTADAFFSYWMALRFSQRAYDRSLIELVREVSLHLSSSAPSLEFDLPDAALVSCRSYRRQVRVNRLTATRHRAVRRGSAAGQGHAIALA